MNHNKGGRPRNAWTSSRRRKLVRLYTLTTLNINEIVRVLEAHEFNPSSRDVQKNLRELFSADYTKNYKTFRPPKERSESFRLQRLRAKPNPAQQISPSLGLQSGRNSPPAKATYPRYLQAFEGPSSAFRGVSIPNHISAPHTLISGIGSEPESQIVVPSRLLLDGSSIPAQSTPLPHTIGTSSVVPILPEHQPPTSVCQGKAASVTRLSLHQSVISIKSLSQRLKRSSSILQHVHSVLDFSLASSLRSSVSSGSGSLWRKASSRTSKFLSANAEKVWHELIAETSHNKSFSGRPQYDGMGFNRRPCCSYDQLKPTTVEFRCFTCGRFTSHCLVYHGQNAIQSNALDYFGNTLLHFAAASPSPKYEFFVDLINAGTDVRSVNTLGETFLHTLFAFIKLGELPVWIDLLRYLGRLDFPFSTRDHYGRTVLHTLVDKQATRKLAPETLEALIEAVKAMKPNLDAIDNLGATIMDYLYASNAGELRQSQPLDLRDSSSTVDTTFVSSLQKHRHDFAGWLNWITETDKYSWIDSTGDTPLLAVMKVVSVDEEESFLVETIAKISSAGTSIHMRDRNGETALAIATRRGLRPAVTTLVRLGVSVHCRDVSRMSILQRARRHLRNAKEEQNDRLYATILSCMVYLVDVGAVKHPNGFQEWAVPSSPLAQNPMFASEAKVTQDLINCGLV
ncbi:hypothetical protein BDZ45DRAFT_727467 [Acephala macrosclerotiorum]|nr:hypothetical protein BDZ45DRAFT_727467 [Acephala macrosclerotiorum]